MSRLLAFLALSLSLLVLSACAGDDAQTPPAEGDETAAEAPADAAAAPEAPAGEGCSLLSPEEVSEVLGLPMTGATGNGGNCELTTASGELNASYDVAPTTAVYESLGQGGEPISGLGEAAVWVPQMNIGGAAYVKKGGQTLQVVVASGTGGRNLRADAEALARALEPKL
jgi:hypothetical protein